MNINELTAGEFFAGGGGWTSGLEKIPGIKTKWILNHDEIAIKTNAFHHKNVKVYWADIYAQDEHELERVDYLHASIECTQHSNANAGRDKKIGSYTMGWELYRYLKFLQPLAISIENVPEFKKWAPVDESGKPIKNRKGEEFVRWKNAIMALGYEYKESIRNAADDGLPTRRVRYFGFFFRSGMNIHFPSFTHSKNGEKGLKKHEPCRPHIDVNNYGESIFGRQFNLNLKKQHRKEISDNSKRRIGAGIMRYYPELVQFLAHHYGGNPERYQSLDGPINTIPTANKHQLITIEKLQFIMDYCRTDNFNKLSEPLKPVLTRQTKQIVSIENFLCQVYGGSNQSQTLDAPINTVPCRDVHQLIRLEKIQFIARTFNSNGNPGYNVQSLEEPLTAVLQNNKHQLITFLDNFDIKARFLTKEELAACSTFPKDYFSKPELKLSHKKAIKLIGNAVPPKWATLLMAPNVANMINYKLQKKSA